MIQNIPSRVLPPFKFFERKKRGMLNFIHAWPYGMTSLKSVDMQFIKVIKVNRNYPCRKLLNPVCVTVLNVSINTFKNPKTDSVDQFYGFLKSTHTSLEVNSCTFIFKCSENVCAECLWFEKKVQQSIFISIWIF